MKLDEPESKKTKKETKQTVKQQQKYTNAEFLAEGEACKTKLSCTAGSKDRHFDSSGLSAEGTLILHPRSPLKVGQCEACCQGCHTKS